MRSALVNKLYCTDVYFGWVSCPQFPSWFEHCFHLDHWMQDFPNGCYCIPGALVHMRLSAHALRPPQCQISFATRDSRSHVCEKMFQVFQTLTFAWNNSTEAFASGSSASQHSDVTVRFFESDTLIIERARLRVHSTWMSGNSTRHLADFTTIVILGVTVRLVSMFLFRCPGKSDFRSRQVTSTQCTQLTLEKLDLALHGGKGDGIDLTTLSHSD